MAPINIEGELRFELDRLVDAMARVEEDRVVGGAPRDLLFTLVLDLKEHAQIRLPGRLRRRPTRYSASEVSSGFMNRVIATL